MSFPSLIFETKTNKIRNEYSVFTDLKLDLLLSENTLKVISYYTSPEDIENRAEMFSFIENNNFKSVLIKLNETARHINYAVSQSENKSFDLLRYVLFVTQIKYYCDFAHYASKLTDGFFAKRFSEYFVNVIENEIPAFEDEAVKLYDECAEALKFELSISPEKAAFGYNIGKDYESELMKCAEFFGAEIAYTDNNDTFEHITVRAIKEYGELENKLLAFYSRFSQCFDPSVCDYAEETGFYLEVSSLIERIKEWGMPICDPHISHNSEINASKVYDYTLMAKNEKEIVPNDIALIDESKFCFLRGANGGGKTTYLRCVGVNAILALCGAKAAADSFEIFDYEKIYTHFPRDERFDRGGRLCDEETRLSPIQNNADNMSLVLLNETYSTTGAKQSDEMTAALAIKLNNAGCTGIYVTHAKLDALSDVPVLCVVIDPNDENRRTFRVEKETVQKGSFAEDILRRYSLDKASLSERFGEI